MFIYSSRPGTPAANLEDNTPHSEKVRRLQALNEIIEAENMRINESMVSTIQPSLVMGVSKRSPDELQARTANNRIVNFVGDLSLLNQMVSLEIVDAFAHSLAGRLVDTKSTHA